MAKDGTRRGGARIGNGRKPTTKKKLEIHEPKFTGVNDFVAPDEIKGIEIPPIKDYLKAKQKNGKDLQAEQVFISTFTWLKQRGCEKAVGTNLIEQYAMSVSRWIQCEEAISEYGFLAKHPTTGNAIASPYVLMSQTYMKQVNTCWYQIYQIVRDNGSLDNDELDAQDLMMEQLLKQKKK